MEKKFELFNQSFKSQGNQAMRGNHLLLFDGASHQIIKLDAQIGLRPKTASAVQQRKTSLPDEDPTSIIKSNK